MPAFLYFGLNAIVVLGLGWPIVVRLTDERVTLYEKLTFAVLLGYIVEYYAVEAVGWVRLDVPSMSSLLAVLGIVALFGLKTIPWRVLAAAARRVSATRDFWLSALILGFAVIALSSLVQGLAPPNDYDSLMYHLAGPRFDVESGRIDVPWSHEILGAFLYPEIMVNQSRMALVLANAGAAQLMHGLMGIIAAVLAALLTRRLGFGRAVAVLAAVLFISVRAVVWEMGSAEVDVPLAAFSAASMLSYAILRNGPSLRAGVLFGATIGGAILTKYHGFGLALAYGPIILFDLWRTRRFAFAMGPLVALTMMIPHGIWRYVLTGNPIFPIFNNVFNPGKRDLFAGGYQSYGTGMGPLDFLSAPWFFSVEPLRFFDGVMLGFPILLIFAPIVLFEKAAARQWRWLAGIALIYYACWFVAFTQQVRFILPIMPLLCSIAAVGASSFWMWCDGSRLSRAAFAVLAGALAAGQLAYVGIYALLRLPVALGVRTPAEYHSNTPTMQGARYVTCEYIADHLAPGERYLALGFWLSYYCPQRAAVVNYFDDEGKWWIDSAEPPQMSFSEFVHRYQSANFRFVLLPTATSDRRNETAEEHIRALTAGDFRFGPYFEQASRGLRPLAADRFSAVYDGAEVLKNLEEQLKFHSDSNG